MAAAASAEWRRSRPDEAVPTAIAKSELRQLLVIASAAGAGAGPKCLLTDGLTAASAASLSGAEKPLKPPEPKALSGVEKQTAKGLDEKHKNLLPLDASAVVSSTRRHSTGQPVEHLSGHPPPGARASNDEKRRNSVATCTRRNSSGQPGQCLSGQPLLGTAHPLFAGLECYGSTGHGDEPSWRPLAAPKDRQCSSNAAAECSSGSEQLSGPCRGATDDLPTAWFQPSDVVNVLDQTSSDGSSTRARVLLVDRAEGKYKVRMRDGAVRTVPADQVSPPKASTPVAP